jgi:uncharacterized membrane protein
MEVKRVMQELPRACGRVCDMMKNSGSVIGDEGKKDRVTEHWKNVSYPTG